MGSVGTVGESGQGVVTTQLLGAFALQVSPAALTRENRRAASQALRVTHVSKTWRLQIVGIVPPETPSLLHGQARE